METIGHILNKCLNDLGIQKSVKRYRALQIWHDVVGERISKVTEPVRMSDAKLFVKVKNDTWRNEIVFYKKEIIGNINKALGSAVIDDIVFL
jgi:predicted nucleic acid-binding Zn ribbon protein